MGTKPGNCFDHLRGTEAQRSHRFEMLLSKHGFSSGATAVLSHILHGPVIKPTSKASLRTLANKTAIDPGVNFCILHILN